MLSQNMLTQQKNWHCQSCRNNVSLLLYTTVPSTTVFYIHFYIYRYIAYTYIFRQTNYLFHYLLKFIDLNNFNFLFIINYHKCCFVICQFIDNDNEMINFGFFFFIFLQVKNQNFNCLCAQKLNFWPLGQMA